MFLNFYKNDFAKSILIYILKKALILFLMFRTNNASKKKKTKEPPSSIKSSKKTEITVSSTICHKYLLTKFINEGSFGKIYVAHNTVTNVDYAAKIEILRLSDPKFYETLVREAKILYELKGQLGFPKMIYFLKDSKYNFMIITLLGENLDDLFNLCQKQFSLYTVLYLAKQMISRLEVLHTEGYIHRDIKPDNFLFGLGDKSDLLYLIDFGLSKKYLDSNSKHLPFKKNLTMVGTPRYTSIHSHLGYEHSRRDDFESLGYILIMLIKGSLPWMNIKAESKSEKQRKIAEIKMMTSIETLCEDLPREFEYYMNHVKNLNFSDQPNYAYLTGLFENLKKKMFAEKMFPLDWTKLNNYKDKLQLVRKDTDKKKNVHYSKLHSEEDEGDYNKKFLAPQKSLQVERISMPLSPNHYNNKSLDRIDSILSKNKETISANEEVKSPERLGIIEEKNSSSNSIYINDDCDKNEKKEINEFEDNFILKQNMGSEENLTSTKDKKKNFSKNITKCSSQEFEKHSENISETILNEYINFNESVSDFILKLEINKLNFINNTKDKYLKN